MVSHDLLGQVRPTSSVNRTSEHPIFWRFVTRLGMPLPQCLNQIIVSRNRFLGTLGLAYANNVLNDGACDVDLFCLKVNVLPFQCENLTSSQARGYRK
jgi:hypothetical protein